MIPEFQIAKLELREGDTLVLRMEAVLRHEIRDALYDSLKKIVPEGVKCAILDGGMTLEVLRKV